MKRGEIGKRLKKLREFRGVSQNWLARRVHVTRQAISYYENSLRGIDADLADEILKALGGIVVLGIDLTDDEALFIRKALTTYRNQKARRPTHKHEKNTT